MSAVNKYATPFDVLTPEKALDFAVRCEARANNLDVFEKRAADAADFRAMAAIWRQFVPMTQPSLPPQR